MFNNIPGTEATKLRKLRDAGTGGGQLPLLPFTRRGKGGKGGLLIKGKYLLLIERIRSCYYLYKLYIKTFAGIL
jgi:hypothetical protein